MDHTPYHRQGPALGAALLALLALLASTSGADELQTEFDQAMSAIEADQLRTARNRLLGLLGGNPSLHRARLELARVYYMSQDYANARAEAERVLEDPNTPQSVRTVVLAFLAQIDADEKRFMQRHVWTPSVYAGVMYDTNVNVGPNRDVIEIGGLPFVVTPESRETEDWALVVNPILSHTFNPNKRFEAGEQDGFLLWQSEAGAYYRGYLDEDDYNLGVLTLRTGPAWVVPRHWRAWVGLQADQIWLGDDSLALLSSLNPGVAWTVSPATEVTLEGLVTQRHYWDDDEDGRDGWYQSVRLSATRYFRDSGITLQGGVGYVNFNADENRFGHDGPEAYVGLYWEAWRRGVVFGRIGYIAYEYDGDEPIFNIARDDDEWRYTLGFSHEFDGGLLRNWALQGSWVYTDNRSNLELYDYDRHAVNLGLARRF